MFAPKDAAASVVGRVFRSIRIVALAVSVLACSSTTAPASSAPALVSPPARSPAASSSAAPDPVIAAAGDIACDPAADGGAPARCDQAATAAQIVALKPVAVLALGDQQYEKNTASAYASVFDKSWGQFKDLIHPTIGNHEYLTPDAAGYFGYFGAAAGDPSQGYYSWNLGAWHVIALNSECSHIGGCRSGSPQETWLKADLAANPTACTLVALAGHNHDYERFPTLDGSGNPDPAGVQEFVVGTGGKNHYPFKAPAIAGEVRDDTSFGILRMTLHSASYDWEFLPAPGYAFTDSGSMACR
jgi:hypothetical protein